MLLILLTIYRFLLKKDKDCESLLLTLKDLLQSIASQLEILFKASVSSDMKSFLVYYLFNHEE